MSGSKVDLIIMNHTQRTQRLEKIAESLGRQKIITQDTLDATFDNLESDVQSLEGGLEEMQSEMTQIRFMEGGN